MHQDEIAFFGVVTWYFFSVSKHRGAKKHPKLRPFAEDNFSWTILRVADWNYWFSQLHFHLPFDPLNSKNKSGGGEDICEFLIQVNYIP